MTMKFLNRGGTAIAALVLLAGVASPGTVLATPFVHETVDANAATGSKAASLAVDSHGNSCLSFWGGASSGLRYGTKSGGTWTFEIVPGTQDFAEYVSLALDAEDNPHISYYDYNNSDLMYAARNGNAWTIETVEAAGNVGEFNSLTLDVRGNPRISYVDRSAGTVKFAAKNGAIWTIETLEGIPVVNSPYTSLELDAHGNPSISYFKYDVGLSAAHIRYAAKTVGAWVFENVDGSANNVVCLDPSLALDRQGHPCISYRSATAHTLFYAVRNDGAWISETVDASADVGVNSSLALDAQGRPCVSYYDVTNGDLKYATKTGSAWTIESVDVAGNVGLNSALVLDPQGNPRISYLDGAASSLKYTDSAVHLESPLGGEHWLAGSPQTVHWLGAGSVSVELSPDGGASFVTLLSGITSNTASVMVPDFTSDRALVRITRSAPLSTSESRAVFSIGPDLVSPWWTAAVDTTGQVGFSPSLALDAQDEPRICYGATDGLRFAAKHGATWAIETVVALPDGATGSLDLGAEGRPGIAFCDYPINDLHYATKSGTVWVSEIVETGDFTSPSLQLDSQGNPRIGYFDYANGDLKFAARNGAAWTIETVDAPGYVGGEASMALDSGGNPRISYLDGTNGELKYAAKHGAAWTIETVDAGLVGYSTSLALDGQGTPHISYLDLTRDVVKYAVRNGASWLIETVASSGPFAARTSLAVDAQGNPRISYHRADLGELKFAVKHGTTWTIETLANTPFDASPSLVLDTQGNPRISYFDGDLKYVSAAVELASPSPGDTWPVGASRTVSWDGTGSVNLSMSVDGGYSWDLLASGLNGGSHRLIVPHTPTRFAQLKLERAVPHSVSATGGLFSIETSVSLLNFAVNAPPEGGAILSWRSDPGPADLAGYRLERGDAGRDFNTLVPLTRETSYVDAAGGPGSRYRLFAVNGLGEELLLGEGAVAPSHPLAAWPLPYRGGDLRVSFAAAGGLGGGNGRADVTIFDLQGRVVRSLVAGMFPQGFHAVSWDGRDDSGRRVPSGAFFLTSVSGGESRQVKLIVTR